MPKQQRLPEVVFWVGIALAGLAATLGAAAAPASPLAVVSDLAAVLGIGVLGSFVAFQVRSGSALAPAPWRGVAIRYTSPPPARSAPPPDPPALTEKPLRAEVWVAWGLAAVTTILAIGIGSTVAGGSDSYGYVSEADLWLKGDLKVRQPWVSQVPWPRAPWTFSPLGYKPFQGPGAVGVLVPTYSPGLPLLMALAKLVAGHAALFLVVPLSAGLLVIATYGIGRRLGMPRSGLIAAWLVASSPTVLFMMRAPMTDVPVAAAWAGAFFLLLGTTRTSAVGAGLAAAVAIMIRPNLVFGAGIFGLRYLFEVVRAQPDRRVLPLVRGTLFSFGVVPGLVLCALFNNALYGSPFTSGYGKLSALFAWGNLGKNAELYTTWLCETQTPLALLGLFCILVPLKRVWPEARDRFACGLMGLFSLGVLALYCGYLVFEVWWYLRFLLVIWPFMLLGLGAALMSIARSRGRWGRVLAGALVLGVGVHGYAQAAHRHILSAEDGETRYVAAARIVSKHTDPNSVVLSMQHSGTLRYYAGRVTLRYDSLDSRWLDRAVLWLSERGVRVYLLVDSWELPKVKERFAGQATAKKFATPIVTLNHHGQMFLFDLSSSKKPRKPIVTAGPPIGRWEKPAPALKLEIGD